MFGGSLRQGKKKTLDKLTQMSRTTQKSCRPRVSDRIMVGTLANTSACEASGPEGAEPSRHETLESEPSTGLVSLEYPASSRQARHKLLRHQDGAGCKGQHPPPLGGDGEDFFLDIPSYRITYATPQVVRVRPAAHLFAGGHEHSPWVRVFALFNLV
jgi:hypothetical protein